MKNEGFKTERVWIGVNVGNLRHNAEALKKARQPGCERMAVVKARAYGHGAVLVAMHLNRMGVRAFAVATIEEAVELREAGVCGEILILGYTDVGRASELKEYDLMQTPISFEYVGRFEQSGNCRKSTHQNRHGPAQAWDIRQGAACDTEGLFDGKPQDMWGVYSPVLSGQQASG